MKEKNSEERMQAENKRNYRAHQELVTLCKYIKINNYICISEF